LSSFKLLPFNFYFFLFLPIGEAEKIFSEKGQTGKVFVCFVAGLGITIQRMSAVLIATGTIRTIETTISVFGWPETFWVAYPLARVCTVAVAMQSVQV